MRKTLFFLMILVLFAAACGEDSTPTASDADAPAADDTADDAEVDDTEMDDAGVDGVGPDDIVFIWSETGGCAMAGPNCARYEITASGEVSTYREGEADVAVTGTVDVAKVTEWIEVVGSTDLDELIGRLGPGETKAAFDGVDHTLEAPQAGLNVSSVDVDFNAAEPVFKEAWALADLAADSAPLALKQR